MASGVRSKKDLRIFGFLLISLLVFIIASLEIENLVFYLFSFVLMLISLITLLRPFLLRKPLAFWMRLTKLVSKVMTPLELAFLYFVVLTPFGLVFNLLKIGKINEEYSKAEISNWKEEFADINLEFFRKAY